MNNEKKQKAPGIIRWNAIIPFTIILILFMAYMHFFFDSHIKSAMEWAGYKALGAEVNIAKVKTSFSEANISIQGIELTDSEKPTQNAIKIGEVKFGMLWDALLRARIVVNEAAVEQIEFAVPRQTPGKVAPPEAIKTNEPSALTKETDKLKQEALSQAKQEYNDNVLGDVVSMLGGADPNAQLKQLESNLASKEMLKKFQDDLAIKQKQWDEKIKSLPQGKEIQALGDKLGKVKFKDFKNPQELQQSLQELDSIFKEADAKYKVIQATSNDFNSDFKNTEAQYKAVEEQIKKDIKDLEAHFRIPKIDAKSLSRAIFMKYLSPYLNKANHYKQLAEKYVPPKFMKKKNGEAVEDDSIQPHPREKGISYEFSRPNSYPMFWIKRTAISSQAGASKYAGNIAGEILDITSNQKLTGKPTVLNIKGDFPAMEVSGFNAQATLDNRKTESEIKFLMNVGSYALNGKELVSSPDVGIAFKKAYGNLKLNGSLIALKNFSMNLDNQFSKIDYDISAKNEVADQILKAVFAGIPVVTLDAKLSGNLPSIDSDVNSNLGGELQKGFEKQIQAKIDEAHKKIQAYIDTQIGTQKAQVDAEMNKLKNTANQEIQKVQSQLDGQKKQAESKVDQAKKDASRQGQKKLEEEGKKVLDDLKSKFGL